MYPSSPVTCASAEIAYASETHAPAPTLTSSRTSSECSLDATFGCTGLRSIRWGYFCGRVFARSPTTQCPCDWARRSPWNQPALRARAGWAGMASRALHCVTWSRTTRQVARGIPGERPSPRGHATEVQGCRSGASVVSGQGRRGSSQVGAALFGRRHRGRRDVG